MPSHKKNENALEANSNTALPRDGQCGFYQNLFRPCLFQLDAEKAHHFVIRAARGLWSNSAGRALTRKVYAHGVEPMPVNLAGLELQNPIGIAAGFDKNAELALGLESLGFGFLEIGTVTPRPQLGNPKPRMSRIPDRRALLNRMGFNNDGADAISARLRAVRSQIKIPLGINLGKNKDTPNSEAVSDYEKLFQVFRSAASYFVINISSPNTPGLRDLQSGEFIQKLGAKILELRIAQPVFVKLAPDISPDDLAAVATLCGKSKPYAGLILTNTIPTDLGGMSGAPLKGPSVSALKAARKLVAGDIPIISVGGIETCDDVIERLKLGANAVQLYSSLVYQGPGLPGRILRELQKKLRNQGIRSPSDLRNS